MDQVAPIFLHQSGNTIEKHYNNHELKNLRIITYFLLSLMALSNHSVSAKEVGSMYEQAIHEKTERYFHYLYQQIHFPKGHALSYEAFRYAVHGYFTMQEAGKLKPNALLTVCDFTLSGNQKRMWVIDLAAKKVLFNTLVAHGMGTGEEFARTFSNQENSHQSSLGFYVTGETYLGAHGLSLKLHGEDGLFNSNAFNRGIVVHAADYVSEEFARSHQRIGRSHGCPALPADIAPKVIEQIRDGSCLFIYHSSSAYLQASAWLRKEVRQLPQDADRIDMLVNANLPATNTASANQQQPASSKPETKTTEVPDRVAPDQQGERRVTSIIVVHENDRIGSSDTLRVR